MPYKCTRVEQHCLSIFPQLGEIYISDEAVHADDELEANTTASGMCG